MRKGWLRHIDAVFAEQQISPKSAIALRLSMMVFFQRPMPGIYRTICFKIDTSPIVDLVADDDGGQQLLAGIERMRERYGTPTPEQLAGITVQRIN